jgi:hypothetical protein
MSGVSTVMLMRFRLTRLMMWMALAATLMYFFDPDRGEKRRRELRARIDAYRGRSGKTELETSP